MPRKIVQSWPGAMRGAVNRWQVAAVACAAVTLTLLVPGAGARAANGLADLAAVAPVMDCGAVASLDLTGATDAPVTIQSASVVTAGAPAPYCDVKGTIAPANMFELQLPTQGWTQRYLEVGCGGLCGSIRLNPPMAAACVPVADGQTAMATTDMGHEGANDGSWAANDPQAQIDFAYRSMHVLSQVSKAIIAKFYGQKPAYSYFDGCSDGGREALIEAQRYPEDFDGIAAGAPANDLVVQNTFHHGWNAAANLDANGSYILLASKLPLIHQAVLDACDGLDGVTDGVLDDPRRCHFDPATLLCASGQDPSTCLSQAEAGVVRRLHDGPTDPDGRHLEQPIAHEWGSELDWSLFVPATATGPSGSVNFALPFLRYLAFQNVADPSYQLADLKFTVPYFWKTVQSSTYWAATDPDLSRFAGRGGKLVLWHGWGDQHITPQGTLQYYHDMRELLGDDAVAGFAKLYLFPGVAHCGGAQPGNPQGPNVFDILTPVMAWVETGTAPEAIIASSVDVTSGAVTRTRPVFPYPTVARYTGSGSTDDAANFAAYTPRAEPGPGYRWVGEGLYSDGYQAKCEAEGTQLVCRPSHFVLRNEQAANGAGHEEAH